MIALLQLTYSISSIPSFDLQAYEDAMRLNLYDAVSVHGSQGLDGPIKAYACTNRMEYFAELSVAYHYHVDDLFEYNKWFPFNRCQLRSHDDEARRGDR